jgi:signal transduction histidine kinase
MKSFYWVEEQKANKETESASNVKRQLLISSKFRREGEALEKKDFEVSSCVEEVLMIFAGRLGGSGPVLAYRIDSKVPEQVNGDRKRLSQVLINLVENAVRFTKKGEVFLDIRSQSSKKDNNIGLVFKLRDTGTGIPANRINLLFKEINTKELCDPTGGEPKSPGLIVCKKMVELMGGTIGVLSQPGLGTTFTFKVSFGHALKPRHPFMIPAPGSGKRIVVTSIV